MLWNISARPNAGGLLFKQGCSYKYGRHIISLKLKNAAKSSDFDFFRACESFYEYFVTLQIWIRAMELQIGMRAV